MKPGAIFLSVLAGGCALVAILFFAEIDLGFSSGSADASKATVPASHAAPVAVNASSKWGQANDIIGGTIILVAEARDDAPWLADAPYKSIMLPKSPTGNEAVPLLRFILDNYDDLPPRIIFVNGGSIPEQRKEIGETLVNIDPKSYPYAGFSGFFRCFRAASETREGIYMRACWAESGAAEYIAPLPIAPRDIISSSCCSNFLVQRTAILGNPRSTYQKLFDWIASSKLDAENLKQCMSFTWHKLFGRGWRNWQIDPNLLCPNKPSTCAHTEHVYAIC